MTIYITGTLLTLLMVYIANNIGKSRSLTGRGKIILPKLFAFLSVIPLTAIMAFRYGVGTDYWSYSAIYSSNGGVPEFGFNLLMKALRFISDDPQMLFAATAIIICLGYYRIIYKESISPVYSILLFVICKDYFTSMNLLRQYVASAIAVQMIPYIKNRDWKKCLILSLAAFLMHRSAIIFLGIYIFYHLCIHPFVGITIFGGLLFLSRPLGTILYSVLRRFNFYSGYFLSTQYGNTQFDLNLGLILIHLCFYALLCYEYGIVKKNQNLRLLYSSVLYTLLLMAISDVMPLNFGRLSHYMNIFLILYVPEAVKNLNDKRLRLIVNLLIVVFYIIVTFPGIGLRGILFGDQGVLPYVSIFSRR